MSESEPLWATVHQMRRVGLKPPEIAGALGLHPMEVLAINLEVQRLLRVEGLSDDQVPTPLLDRCRRRLRDHLTPRVETPALHLPGGEVYDQVLGEVAPGRAGG